VRGEVVFVALYFNYAKEALASRAKEYTMQKLPMGRGRTFNQPGKIEGGKTVAETAGEARAALAFSGFFLLAGLTLCWGFNWPIMKIALGEVKPWTFRTLCLMIGGFGLLAIAKLNGFSLRIPRRERLPLLLVSLLNITGWHLSSAYGLILMNAGRAVILAYTMPLWTSILSILVLGERLTPVRLAGLGLGLAGMAILISADIEAVGAMPLGALFMVIAALSWAAGTVAIKYFHWTMPTSLLTGWQLIVGGVPVVIGALIMEPFSALSNVSTQAILATAYAILGAMIFCHYAWFKMVHILPAPVAAIATLAIPVVGVFSSALILGEPAGFRELLSLALVVSALAIVLIGPFWLRPSRPSQG